MISILPAQAVVLYNSVISYWLKKTWLVTKWLTIIWYDFIWALERELFKEGANFKKECLVMSAEKEREKDILKIVCLRRELNHRQMRIRQVCWPLHYLDIGIILSRL